ncbi:MAG: hypothetical protein GC192_23565 [Bacteroidetes bacterium]|nr:hypothetical protein [Bacteroidota bacterium]
MNKLDISSGSNTGGLPLALNDIVFLQDAFRDSFKALSKENAILSGCRISVIGSGAFGALMIGSGYLMLGGEIYYFEGDNLWGSYSDPVFVVLEYTYTNTGYSPVSFADGSSQDIHKIRKAVIQEYASQPAYYRIKDLFDYGDSWHRVGDASDIIGGYNGSSAFGDGATYTFGSDTKNLSIRKSGEYLELRGAMETNAFSNNQVAFTLPVVAGHNSYRPLYNCSFMVPAASSGSGYPDKMMMITVFNNGQVMVHKGDYTGSGTLRFHINVRIPLF